MDKPDPKVETKVILELYENPDELKRLGEQGRKYAVENYGIEQAINKYENLFALKWSLTKIVF